MDLQYTLTNTGASSKCVAPVVPFCALEIPVKVVEVTPVYEMSSESIVKVPVIGNVAVLSTVIAVVAEVLVIAPSNIVKLGQLLRSCIFVVESGIPSVKAQYCGSSNPLVITRTPPIIVEVRFSAAVVE